MLEHCSDWVKYKRTKNKDFVRTHSESVIFTFDPQSADSSNVYFVLFLYFVFHLQKHSAAVLLTIGPQSSGSTYVDYANTWFNPVFHCQGKIIQVCSTGTASLRQKNWDRATISSLSRNTFQIYENRSWEGALSVAAQAWIASEACNHLWVLREAWVHQTVEHLHAGKERSGSIFSPGEIADVRAGDGSCMQ